MRRKLLPVLALLLIANIAKAQDPMLTNWWFNTTNNMINGILTDVESVYYTTTDVYVKSSGVPNYYQFGINVNDASDLHATWDIPRVPVPSANPQGVMGGQMGLMIDGSVFFHPGDAQSYNSAGVWNRLAYFFEIADMDPSNGHSTPNNMYHHHFDNLKLHNFDSTVHSPIVGFAWDGYPLYGPYGYANTDGTGGIKRMVSSYATPVVTTRTNGPAVGGMYPLGCFIEDWAYTAGSGDLDAHNGRFCKTPEYPNGTYAYFTTIDANLLPYYPYFIGPTFYGTFSMSNTGPTGGASVVPGTATQYTPPTSVNQLVALENNIKLYPIPVQTDLTIQVTDSKNYTVTLYDLKGSVLQTKQITTTTVISMSNLPYGVYFVQLYEPATGNGFIKRIVKQ